MIRILQISDIHWTKRKNWDADFPGMKARFLVDLEDYHIAKGNIDYVFVCGDVAFKGAKVQMKLDNFYWGDIEVFETDKIDLRVVHTGYSVRFNYYQLDNQTLIIRGKASPAKGGKNCTVRITPVVI